MNKQGWYVSYSSHLDELGKLAQGWDSYGSDPPSETAIQNAHGILNILSLISKPPSRIAPLADGGVIIWFNEEGSVECSNNGRITIEARS
ncbi:hypothetical protein LCGC14_3029930 [marine sediment metagenome]|uniref:Uncharacterized protein n=1 Tax=marine sediment metagenome TaxID=412755 RepID=A0A0F8ZIX1_9ZZZZ